jgi:flagellar biosynthesis/type III secretory pathway chaperone
LTTPEEQQLTLLLNNELTCLQNLLDTLNQEFEALTNSDIEALEQITLQKNTALAKQAEATISRQNFAATLMNINVTDENTEQGLQQLIANYENQVDLSKTINKLQLLAEQCQTTNRSNGRLILQKQKHTRNALDILRQADSNPSTYSGQGDTVTRTEGRILGKA